MLTRILKRIALCISLILVAAPIHAQPLTSWPVDAWNPESQAACGAFMTKFGYMLSGRKKGREAFQVLYRGLAINKLSEMTDPETNGEAWLAEVDLVSEEARLMMNSCLGLFTAADNGGMIPESILEAALKEANDANR